LQRFLSELPGISIVAWNNVNIHAALKLNLVFLCNLHAGARHLGLTDPFHSFFPEETQI
jgi:hypothetical protein